MSTIELKAVSKQFGAIQALDQVSFTVRNKEFFVLLGPTGAGKTTTLRIISALEKQDSGSVFFDGASVDQVQPAERDVAMVFQQYSLYPTMTVYDNLAFPLRSPMHRLPEPQIRERVTGTAEKLRISHLLERKTARLSGGEMQRVAIGRAIVRKPRAFLMDEPLSNLDAKLREALRVELQHLQKTEGDTTLYVTHDQVEALTMADRIGILNQGRIVQIGTPADIYDRPATTFVATLVGSPRINLLPGACADGMIAVDGADLRLAAPADAAGRSLPPMPQLQVGIRPEDVVLRSDGRFTGAIQLTEPLGVETILHIRTGSRQLLSLCTGMASARVGETVRFDILPDRLHLFGADGRRVE